MSQKGQLGIFLKLHTNRSKEPELHPLAMGQKYLLGREAEHKMPEDTIHIVLTAESCSRRHVLLRVDERGRCYLQQLANSSGTWISSTKLKTQQEYQLDVGQRFRMGEPPNHVMGLVQDPKREAAKKRAREEERAASSGPGPTVNGHAHKVAAEGGNAVSSTHPGTLPSVPSALNGKEAAHQAESSKAGAMSNGAHEAPAAKRRMTLPSASDVHGPAPRHPAEDAALAKKSSSAPSVMNGSASRPQTNGTAQRSIGPELPPGYSRPSQPESQLTQSQRRSSLAPTAASSSSKGGRLKCDKCDGPHDTNACPHFKKGREDHKDAWVNYGRKHPLSMGSSGGRQVVRGGRTIKQPGDGNCLFHSLAYGLARKTSQRFSAQNLRRELADYVDRNPKLEISGDTLEEWVRWDTRKSVSQYASSMRHSGWGGGIEMAACSHKHQVNVHVYERRRGDEFERISCFDCPGQARFTVHVLYQGGVHFDVYVPPGG